MPEPRVDQTPEPEAAAGLGTWPSAAPAGYQEAMERPARLLAGALVPSTSCDNAAGPPASSGEVEAAVRSDLELELARRRLLRSAHGSRSARGASGLAGDALGPRPSWTAKGIAPESWPRTTVAESRPGDRGGRRRLRSSPASAGSAGVRLGTDLCRAVQAQRLRQCWLRKVADGLGAGRKSPAGCKAVPSPETRMGMTAVEVLRIGGVPLRVHNLQTETSQNGANECEPSLDTYSIGTRSRPRSRPLPV